MSRCVPKAISVDGVNLQVLHLYIPVDKCMVQFRSSQFSLQDLMEHGKY